MPLPSTVGGMLSTSGGFNDFSIGGWPPPPSPSARPDGRSCVCMDGSLDDLPIQAVLQILALGRKSGYLAVETVIGAGALVFREGRVVAAVHDGDGGPPVASEGAPLPRAERDGLIRERLVAFVHRLAQCRRGGFTFVASARWPLVIHGRDVAREALVRGVEVTELLIETACRLEEGYPGEYAGAAPSVLLVDDEEKVRRVLSGYLAEGGYRVVEANDVESAVKKGEALAAAGIRFVLVTNLTISGAAVGSSRGGVEVIRRLEGVRPRPPVVMMADSECWSLSARTMRRVSSVLIKPGLSRLGPDERTANIRTLAGRMIQEVLPRACATALA